MEIKQKFHFVEGTFDTETGELICVEKTKYAQVILCIKSNMHIPFAKIKLHSEDSFVDAEETMPDAYKLGTEICKRWNNHKVATTKIQEYIDNATKQASYAKRDGAESSAMCSEAMAFAYKTCLELLQGQVPVTNPQKPQQ